MKNGMRALAERAKAIVRRLRALRAGVRLLRDPNQLDAVFVLDRGLSSPETLQVIADRVAADPVGATALSERPRLGNIDLQRLHALAEGTLGRAFADHMLSRGLDPAAIPELEAGDDAAFVQAHLYETHDIWHVVGGFDTDVAGELGVQALYAAQLPGRLPPVIIVGGLLQALLFAPGDWESRVAGVVRGWRLGKRARPLFGVRWDTLWEVPLDEVRASLGVVTADA